jgi:hypothetical protein
MSIRILSIIVVLILSLTRIQAQMGSYGYQTQVTDTADYESDLFGNSIDISDSPDLIPGNNIDKFSALQPLGFDLIFMNRHFSHFYVHSNGFIRLAFRNSAYYPLTGSWSMNDLTIMNVYKPALGISNAIIAPFWSFMRTSPAGPTIRSVLTGSAPNRCRTITWHVNIPESSTNNTFPADGEFQLRIYETSGILEFVYRRMTIGDTSNRVKASIGFTNGDKTGDFLALKNLTNFNYTLLAAEEPASQNLVDSNIAGPIPGFTTDPYYSRAIRFTPLDLIGSSIDSLRISNIGAQNMTLSWNDFTTETGYTILRSKDNINFDWVADLRFDSTTYKATGLQTGITYYWKVIPHTDGQSGTPIKGSATTTCSSGGRFTVGTGGDFLTIQKAVDSIKMGGMKTDVLLELTSTYNSNNEIFPVIFPKNADIPCLENHHITIRPAADAAGLVIKGSSSKSLFILDKVNNYLEIDGRPGGISGGAIMSVFNTGTGGLFTLEDASGNLIRYISLLGNHKYIYFKGLNAGSNDNKVEACEFMTNQDPTLGIIAYDLIVSSSENGYWNRRDSIQNCHFIDASSNGIVLDRGSDGWVITGNSFIVKNKTSWDSANTTLISLTEPNNEVYHLVSGNYFGGSGPQCTGLPVPMKPMNFTAIRAKGRVNIIGNTFKRINFDDFYSGSNYNYFIKSEGDIDVEPFRGDVTKNVFGSLDPADSIHLNATLESTFFNFISVNPKTLNDTTELFFHISENQFNMVRANGVIKPLHLIFIQGLGYPKVEHNVIGNPLQRNSIINSSLGSTVGMELLTPVSVKHNTVCNLTGYGLDPTAYVRGITIESAWDSVAHNKVFNLISNSENDLGEYPLTGIGVSNFSGSKHVIYGNTVHSLFNLNEFASQGIVGIDAGASDASHNLIYDLFDYSETNALVYGIRGGNIVSNNMIRLGLDSSLGITSNDISLFGIGRCVTALHNTVYLTGRSRNSLGNFAIYEPISAINNILYVDRTRDTTLFGLNSFGLSLGFYNGNFTSDYNLFYTRGSSSKIGQYYKNSMGTITVNTFTDWKNLGLDKASIFGDPQFIAPLAPVPDLHLQTGTPAEGKGDQTQTTITDIDGENRSALSPVDIGADADNFDGACPVAQAGRDTLLCAGSSLMIGTPEIAGSNYAWTSIPAGFSSTLAQPVVQPNKTTDYILSVTRGNCATLDTIRINVGTMEAPSIEISGKYLLQKNESTSLRASTFNGGSSPKLLWQDSTSSQNFWHSLSETDSVVELSSYDKMPRYVRCILISNAACRKNDTAYSNIIKVITVDTTQATTIRIYPNPATNQITVSLEPSDNWATAEIMNINGAAGTQKKDVRGLNNAAFDISTLPPGQYFIVLRRSDGTAKTVIFLKV